MPIETSKWTDQMIEAGARALAEWHAPNWGGQNFEDNPHSGTSESYREQAKVVMQAGLEVFFQVHVRSGS